LKILVESASFISDPTLVKVNSPTGKTIFPTGKMNSPTDKTIFLTVKFNFQAPFLNFQASKISFAVPEMIFRAQKTRFSTIKSVFTPPPAKMGLAAVGSGGWIPPASGLLMMLERNSKICFHKTMLTKAKAKTIVHGVVHALRPNNC
jgi:hypothetical protein